VQADYFAVPFDWKTLKVTGPEAPVVESVANGVMAVSENGVLAYASGKAEGFSIRPVLVTESGQRELPGEAVAQVFQGVLGPRVSPDGKRLLGAVGKDNASCRLVVSDLVTGRSRTVADSPTWWAVWTPDGRRVVYAHMAPGDSAANLFWKASDGTGADERLTKSLHHQQPQFVTRDGRFLVYQEQTTETGFDLWLLPLSGDRTPTPLARTKANERLAALSPNGNYMAYVSDESGREEVYVRPFPAGGGATPVTNGGGTGPVWAPDGKTLFYRNPQGKSLFAVPVNWEPAPSFGAPTVKAGRWVADINYGRQYDVMPDGRTLVMQSFSGNAGNEITVVLNWFEELKQKMAVRK
jgi:Tol biopolymer transport system component